MRVLIRRVDPKATLPFRASEEAAGWDVTAVSYKVDLDYNVVIYDIGIAIAVPKGYYLDFRARSSIYKLPWMLSNGAGIVDSDYRGTIKAIFRPTEEAVSVRDEVPYAIGDRIAQIVLVKHQIQEYEEVDELPESERGTGGHGSTGK